MADRPGAAGDSEEVSVRDRWGGRGTLRHPCARVRPLVAALAVVILGASLAACTKDAPEAQPPAPTSESAKPVILRFGVFGPPEEVATYEALADFYDAEGVIVEVSSWADRDEAARAFRSGAPLPDVFLVSQRDLAWLTERGLTQPVNELLDERGMNFGDSYSREAITAFAQENELTCMPYAISPMVMYLNTDLVDFDRMARRGLPVPEDPARWDFEQFTAAAQAATRPGKRSRGLYIEPSLAGLAPFIYAGGGQVFDNNQEPTSLAFSAGDTQAALEVTLDLLRDAPLTPTPEQLAKNDPLTLFENGRLGMIAGFRNLVPELREVPGLNFDVMPIPSIARTATVGDVTGMCLSAETQHVSEAADFLLYVLSDEAVSRVARQGYMVPANVAVATSDAFLQPGRMPVNARVFNAGVRRIEIFPLLESWSALEMAVAADIEDLVTVPLLDEQTMQDITGRIDLDSQAVLSPPEPSPSESASESTSPSGSASGDADGG